MKIIVGLGNPGSEYATTKHNAGYWVVDELARRWSVRFRSGKGPFVLAESAKNQALLLKPTTGMNGSGIAVKQAVNEYKVAMTDLYLIVDDVDLPLGSMRLRSKGGDGCHRGLESVIYHLGQNGFPRFRFGVAAADHKRPAEEYVLKPFKKTDSRQADEMIRIVADAIEFSLREGLNKTMNQFNIKGNMNADQ